MSDFWLRELTRKAIKMILLVVFDFETEEDYVDFVEEGYPDIDEHIVESFELNYEDWVYTGNWSEDEIFGDETEFEGEIISV